MNDKIGRTKKDTTNKTRDSDKTCYTGQKGQIDRKG